MDARERWRRELGSWEGKRRRNIKYARTDAWSHSSLPFLPVSLFPILVPSKRFLLSAFSTTHDRLPLSLSLSSRLYALAAFSFLLCVSRAYHPRGALSIGRFFPLCHVITVSTVACADIGTLAWGILFMTLARVFRDVGKST